MANKAQKDTVVDWNALLQRHPIFEALGAKDKAFLLSDEISNKLVLDADEVVLRQGETGNSLFIVCDGSVSVTLEDHAGDPVRLHSLTEGEVFGEMALFGQQLRSATLTTVEPSKLLEIPGDEFLTLMKKHSEIAFYFLAKLTRRLTQNDNMILDNRMTGIDSSVVDLKNKLEIVSQATEAKLAASQTMFEQTNTRANEIIESAGRARTRLTAMLTTGTTILALIIGGSLWNLSTTMEKVTGLAVTVGERANEVETNAGKAKEDATKAGEDAAAGQKHLSDINDVRIKASAALETATKAKNDIVLIKLESLFEAFKKNRFSDLPVTGATADMFDSITAQYSLPDERITSYQTKFNTFLYVYSLTGTRYGDVATLYEKIQTKFPNQTRRSRLMSVYFSALSAIVNDKYEEAEDRIAEFSEMIDSVSEGTKGFWGEVPFTKESLPSAINVNNSDKSNLERRLQLLVSLLEKIS